MVVQVNDVGMEVRDEQIDEALLVIYRLTRSMERFKIIGGDRFLKSDEKNLQHGLYFLKKQAKINKCLRSEHHETIELNKCGFCGVPKYICECDGLLKFKK